MFRRLYVCVLCKCVCVSVCCVALRCVSHSHVLPLRWRRQCLPSSSAPPPHAAGLQNGTKQKARSCHQARARSQTRVVKTRAEKDAAATGILGTITWHDTQQPPSLSLSAPSPCPHYRGIGTQVRTICRWDVGRVVTKVVFLNKQWHGAVVLEKGIRQRR